MIRYFLFRCSSGCINDGNVYWYICSVNDDGTVILMNKLGSFDFVDENKNTHFNSKRYAIQIFRKYNRGKTLIIRL